MGQKRRCWRLREERVSGGRRKSTGVVQREHGGRRAHWWQQGLGRDCVSRTGQAQQVPVTFARSVEKAELRKVFTCVVHMLCTYL